MAEREKTHNHKTLKRKTQMSHTSKNIFLSTQVESKTKHDWRSLGALGILPLHL